MKTRPKKDVRGVSTRKKAFNLRSAISTRQPTETKLMFNEFRRQYMQGRGINKTVTFQMKYLANFFIWLNDSQSSGIIPAIVLAKCSIQTQIQSVYTLSHFEKDRDVSVYSGGRRLSMRVQLCFLTR